MGKSKEIQKKKAAAKKPKSGAKKKWGGTGQGKSGRGTDDNVVFTEKQWEQVVKVVPKWNCITLSKVMQQFNIARSLAKSALEKLAEDELIQSHTKHSKLLIYCPFREEEEEAKVVVAAEDGEATGEGGEESGEEQEIKDE